MGPPALAAPWKNCVFNDQPIRCRDSRSPNGTVRIVWEDGKVMTFRLVNEDFPVSTLRDSLGGIWERQVLVQGNAVFTNPPNGNRIFVPQPQHRRNPLQWLAGSSRRVRNDQWLPHQLCGSHVPGERTR